MIFTRSDSTDNSGVTVSYILADCPGFTFSIISSRAGVVISGTTPAYTDWKPIQQVLQWSQYQAQSIMKHGHAIRQHELDKGGIWI